MSLDTVRAYHEASKLWRLDDAPRRIDAALVPLPYKRYTGLPRIPLLPVTETEKTFFQSLTPVDAPGRVNPPDLAAVLRYSAGIVRRSNVGGRELEFRAASCTGAAYHVELYVVCGGSEGLDAGLYHYDVPNDELVLLAPGDHRRALADACVTPALSRAEAAIVLTSTFWRNAWRYQERAYRHVFWDSGTILANLLTLAATRGMQTQLYTAFVDDQLNAMLDLDPMREAAVAVVGLGPADGGQPGPPAPPPSGLTTEPISRVEIEYPVIWQTHEATGLADAAAVRAWRREKSSARYKWPAAHELPGGMPDLQRAIENRGSARRFDDRQMSRAELNAVLAALEAPVPADGAVPPNTWRTLLLAHAIEGLEPGAYAVEPNTGVSLLRRGDFREEATRLALDQDAAGRAAANLYFVADLDAVLRELGPRGYRLAQLIAGLLTGRVYLACASLGLRTTGLTFHDDEVASFFGVAPEHTAVLMLAAFGP